MDVIRSSLEAFSSPPILPRFDDEVDGTVIKGAIDYVLMPLLFLGVSGPIFVVMYIIMAAVEFKLPPNHQAGRRIVGLLEEGSLLLRNSLEKFIEVFEE